MLQNGFVDLRINSADSDDANFWPGFTDIMTVIVLIFIMTMLALLAKNSGLLDQLAAAVELRKAAEAEVKVMTDINEELNAHMVGLEGELNQMQIQMLAAAEKHRKAQEEHRRTLVLLNNSEQANIRLNTELEATRESLVAVLDEKEAWSLDRTKLNLKKTMLENSRARFKNRSKVLADKLAEQRKEFSERERKISRDMAELEQLRANNVYCFKMGQEEIRKEREAREQREREERNAAARVPPTRSFF